MIEMSTSIGRLPTRSYPREIARTERCGIFRRPANKPDVLCGRIGEGISDRCRRCEGYRADVHRITVKNCSNDRGEKLSDPVKEFWNQRATFGVTAGTNDFMLTEIEQKFIASEVPNSARVM